MTVRANARLAGATFLIYIAAGLTSLNYAAGPLLHVVLSFVQCFSALVLAVTLYAITRSRDSEIAMLGLTCRVGEGLLGAVYIPLQRALASLATTAAAGTADGAGKVLEEFIRNAGRSNAVVCGTLFAVGSTCFSWLLLRGRMIPAALAWVGVLASVLLVVALPLQLGGVLRGPVTLYIWLPMLAFEVPLALWLLIRGVATPARAA